MGLRSVRVWFEAALFVAALSLALAAGLVARDEDTANIFYFAAWTAALLLLFSLALRLPLRSSGRRAGLVSAGVVLAALATALGANIALYRHDVHIDATAEGRYTAPPQLMKIARHLDSDVAVTYFYNSQDRGALTARDVLAAVARRHPHLQVRAYDLDKELIAARTLGVRMYNSAVVQFQGRRAEVDNTVDLRDVAYAVERVMKRDAPVVCFVTGHGEPYNPQSHVHLSHREVMGAENTAVLNASGGGIDKLVLGIGAIGYSDRALMTVGAAAIPRDCAVVADLGPHTAYAPGEVKLFQDYLARGGRLLLMYDPEFPVTPETEAMLAGLGLGVGSGLVLDPLNHAGPEEDKVAVPYYPPHPITSEIALTVFPGPRPIRMLQQVPNVARTLLIQTSKDSYLRKTSGGLATLAAAQVGPPARTDADAGRGPRILAIAAEGHPPGGEHTPFRLVLVGSAAFATNTFFAYGSNGDLAVSMIRWLAGDTQAPKLHAISYSLNEIRLSGRQMQATFVTIEILLPLSIMLLGVLVWRRRR